MAAAQQAQPGPSRHPTPTERADRGKAARAAAPRSGHDALRDAAPSSGIAVETGL